MFSLRHEKQYINICIQYNTTHEQKAAAANSLSASFSLDPYDLFKLAGLRISATQKSRCHSGPSPRRRDLEGSADGADGATGGGCCRTSKVDGCLYRV